ncbi:MAG: AAA family ATPase, partial [Bythopirellula sp.]
MLSTLPTPKTKDVIRLLRNPRAYAEATRTVELIETHISWVFLTDHYAYKLKKPVRFEFLNFSTPRAREAACAEEIRLNNRLSNNVYLAVVPVTLESDGELKLDGAGDPIDYVVKMRRLPRKLALDELIRQDRLGCGQMMALVDYLVGFYSQLPPKIVRPDHYYQNLLEHCRANYKVLLDCAGKANRAAVRRIHGAQLRYLWLESEQLLNRVRDGRIVDGQGDLRAEHVFLESPPSVIDCVEFSEELRQVDVVDDLSCLAMDCSRLGNHELGSRLLSAYVRQSGDRPSDTMIDLFKCYRACVRAKVAALYLQQPNVMGRKQEVRELHQYLQWADHHAARLGRPLLIVLGGLMGTGKSTLACGLADVIASKTISTDHIRHSLFGVSEAPAAFSRGHYRPELRLQVYGEMFNRAQEYLDGGRSVVLDGTFLTNDLRLRAMELGRKHGATPVFVECECPKEKARSRIYGRSASGRALSEARPGLLNQQAAEREDPPASINRIGVCTSNS